MEAIVKQQTEFSREQIDLIKKTVAVGASDLELKLFMYQAQRTGLDPLSKQIHFIKRAGSGTIQTGIDGYRVIAERTGTYAGNDEPVFGEDGTNYPTKATVTVYRIISGQRCPFTATAFWNEYYPGDGNQGFFWRKMPRGQLAKCAEALALRKAFPNDLSGLYITEEMQQASKDAIVEQHPTEPSLTLDRTVSDEAPVIQTPPSPSTKAEIQEGEGGMVCIVGVLDELKPDKTKQGKAVLYMHVEDVGIACFDTKVFPAVQALVSRKVKAFCTKKVAGTKTYYNLVSMIPFEGEMPSAAVTEDIPF